MKNKLFLIPLVLLLISGHLFLRGETIKPKELAVKSKVETVTVFRDRALVSRLVQKDFEPGSYILKLTNLPLLLLDESVRVSGKGVALAKIVDIKIKTERLEETVIDRISELENKQKELEKRINALDDRLKVLARKDEFIQTILSDKKTSDSGEVEIQKKGIAEWTRIIEFLENTLEKILEEKRTIQSERKTLTDKKAVIDHELAQQTEMRRKERKNIEIEIEVKNPGMLNLAVSYVVTRTSWMPLFDFRFSSAKKEMGLTYQALVTQETGEDWENVSLILSTARPAIENTPPELLPQTLDRPQAISRGSTGSNQIYGKVTGPDGSPIPGVLAEVESSTTASKATAVTNEYGEYRLMDLPLGRYKVKFSLEGFQTAIVENISLEAGYGSKIDQELAMGQIETEIVVQGQAPIIDIKSSTVSTTIRRDDFYGSGGGYSSRESSVKPKAKEPVIQEIKSESAQVSKQVVAATFSLKQKETILSNNKPQKVTINMDTMACEKEYLAIPKLIEETYLKAKVTNGHDFPLLAGKASIFLDESYISTVAIPQVSINEKFEVAIGTESGIKCKRELVKRTEEESGLFSKKVKLTYEYKITVENFHPNPEEVIVTDQIPISDNKDVAIEMILMDPQPEKPAESEEKKKKDGILKWKLSLNSLEKKEIHFAFRVTHPKRLDVFNLE